MLTGLLYDVQYEAGQGEQIQDSLYTGHFSKSGWESDHSLDSLPYHVITGLLKCWFTAFKCEV